MSFAALLNIDTCNTVEVFGGEKYSLSESEFYLISQKESLAKNENLSFLNVVKYVGVKQMILTEIIGKDKQLT